MNELWWMKWRLWLGGNVWNRRRLNGKHTTGLRDRVKHGWLVYELWRRVECGRCLHIHERLVQLQLIAQKLLIVQQGQRTVGLLVEHFFQLIKEFATLLKHQTLDKKKCFDRETNFKFLFYQLQVVKFYFELLQMCFVLLNCLRVHFDFFLSE